MRKDDRAIWLWVRVPLRAIEAAIGALKDRAILRHKEDMRAAADQDDQDAEDIKRGLHGQDDPPVQWRWPPKGNGDN